MKEHEHIEHKDKRPLSTTAALNQIRWLRALAQLRKIEKEVRERNHLNQLIDEYINERWPNEKCLHNPK